MKKALAFFAIFCASVLLFAERTDSSGMYKVRYRGDNIIILGTVSAPSENLVLPKELDGLCVTEIASGAFQESEIVSVTLPENLLKIGDNAFSECSRLESVKFGNKVQEIGDEAFEECTSLKNISLPESLVKIGDYAFFDCTSLESIVVPESVEKFGRNVFRSCTSLKKAEINGTFSELPERTFYYCSALEKVKLPEDLISIEEEAFEDTAISEFPQLEKIEYIGYRAFKNTKITKIRFPLSLRYIDSFAFSDCELLDEVFIARSTHISSRAFDFSPVLLNVFRDSQAAKVCETEDLEYKFLAEGDFGDVEEFSDSEYYRYEGFSYDDYDDEDFAEKVSEEQLAKLVEDIVLRENTSKTSDIAYISSDEVHIGVFSDSDFPAIYELFNSDGETPNFIYIVYASNSSYNNYLFSMLAENLEEDSPDEYIPDSGLSYLYEKIQNYTLGYTTKVIINEKEYEVFCTDIDED